MCKGMKERIIVSLTTYSKRINNIPAVLDTIFSQTVPPDFVVLNLAHEEIVPEEVQRYIDTHPIEVNRVADTKVFKKLIPTLRKYPNDCIIAIDDDWLYPKGMIEDYVSIHQKYPNFPISGNGYVYAGVQCHCGCSSLTKAEFFGDGLQLIDEEVIKNCQSDDFVYTYFSNRAGYPYIRTKGEYFTNMQPYNATDSYSGETGSLAAVEKTSKYLFERFGELNPSVSAYLDDSFIAAIIDGVQKETIKSNCYRAKEEVFQSPTFRLGKFLLKPFSWMKQ